MSDLTLLAPQSSYFSLLNTQSSNGLNNVLQVIQDGLGRNTPLSLSQIALDINTTMGGGFSIDGNSLTATATQINAVCQNASFSAFVSAIAFPAGTTAQRPAVQNAKFRYNTTTNRFEGVENGVWVNFTGPAPDGYSPGEPTYLQDTYIAGTYNVCMGTPEQIVTNRTECTLFGDSVVQSASSGSRLCAFGYQALMIDSSGFDNCAFGHMSGKSTIAGLSNSYFGKSSGQNNATGDRNAFFGAQSGFQATGNDNSYYGSGSGLNIDIGDENSCFGSLACENSENVSECCAFGFSSLQENEISKNSAFGARSATTNISGEHLDAFGYSALVSNVLGDENSAFAQNSLFSNIDGNSNCAFGYESLYSNTSGSGSSAFGASTLRNTVGNFNTAFGSIAGLSVTDGQFNSFFGASSGGAGSVSGLTGCTLLGSLTTVATGLTNATAIGYQAAATISNTIVLGTSGTNVGIGTSNALFPLHVIGSCLFKGITAGFTGTGLLKNQFGRTTSGVVATTVDFLVSTALPGILNVSVKISVINTVGDKSAYSISTAAAFYNGITVASSGTLPTITMTGTAAYTPTAVWSISGNNLRLTLTGVAASNEVWVVSAESFSTSNTAA